VRNTAGGFRPTADQPHGGSLRAKGAGDALAVPLPAWAPSVRNTAGGFRPTADQPHGGSLRAKGLGDALPVPLAARAPSVRNTAGGFRPTAEVRFDPWRMASVLSHGPKAAEVHSLFGYRIERQAHGI